MNGVALAYLGDAYYELSIRRHLLNQGYTSVNILHKKAILFTSSQAQSSIMTYLLTENRITEQEIDVFKRGRNASSHGRGNVSAKTYQTATGFEALIGYLSLNHKERCDEIILKSIAYIEKKIGEML